MAKEQTAPDSRGEPTSVQHRWIGKRVSWEFGKDSYPGTIVRFRRSAARTALWHVRYDDGDSEDFSVREMAKSLVNEESEDEDGGAGAMSISESGDDDSDLNGTAEGGDTSDGDP